MNQTVSPTSGEQASDDNLDLAHYLDVVLDNIWLIVGAVVIFLLFGAGYAFVTKPVYEADIMIQVEDGQSGVQALLGEVSDLLNTKPAASAEIEILRSRLVVAQAASNLQLFINAHPKYFPVFGEWLARRSHSLSKPGLFGSGGYVWGNEHVGVSHLVVPDALEGVPLTLTALGNNKYKLESQAFNTPLEGSVGAQQVFQTPLGEVTITVSSLSSNSGGEFIITSFSQLGTVEALQNNLKISEKGKQSGVIGATLQGTDPLLTVKILNEIGRQYVKQNVERKSAEAQRSLEFLDQQLPQIKTELEQAEDRYNRLRNQKGTIDLGEESRLLLEQSVNGQTSLFDLKQKRQELVTRFTPQHPSVVALDQQIASVQQQLDDVTAKIKNLPSLEQDMLRLTRDVKVNTDLYATLLNNAQQLRLIKAGRIGTVRLVDEAVLPEAPVKPNKALILGLSLLLGAFVGLTLAFLRDTLFGGISNPHDIEMRMGLNVYATIPYSDKQKGITNRLAAGMQGTGLLVQQSPNDAAVESIRSLRTALQFAMLDVTNNVVLITGAAPGIGKSFVSSNLAAVLSDAGKRVLLIDGDLRKGYLHQYFGMSRENGLSELAAGTITFEQALKKDILPGLDFITTGALPPNPGELFMSERFNELVNTWSRGYDIVFIDTPPVLVAADTGIVASKVGTIFLVARSEITTLGELQEAVKQLSNAGASVKGVVFNGMHASSMKYGYGGKYSRYKYVTYKYNEN